MEDKGIQLDNLWAKPKVNKVGLFKGILNIIKDVSTADLLSLPASAVDTIEAISFKESSGKVGWKLISRSIVVALLNLIIENKTEFLKENIVVDYLDKDLNNILESEKFFLGVDFFKHPDKLPFLGKTQTVLKEFLKLFNFNDKEINNIIDRFPSYFIFALVEEWRNNFKYYQVIKNALDTPFNEAAQRENEWFVYCKFLIKQIDNPVFSETFSLRQIYVPLRAAFKIKEGGCDDPLQSDVKKIGLEQKRIKNIVVNLEKELLDWLHKGDKNDSIRIIRGGPGSGKSSFLKIFAAELAKRGKRVLFVPLHRFEIKDDLIVAIQSFLKYDKYLTSDIFEESRLIILFDGLDELSMQGSVLADVASQFLREVERKVGNFNNQKIRLQVIVTGRDVIVQQNESEFRKEKQILSILPYYLNEKEKEEYNDIEGLLVEDQRKDWWTKYGELKGKEYFGLPIDLQSQEIDEITAQPLLNYLVALSYERGKINFSKNPNLNEIYNDLLEAVYHRNYAEGKIHQIVKKLEFPDFTRMLEEIAIAAWHGNGRTTTVADIETHFKDSGIKKLLEGFVKDAEKGMVSLLAAFYFRQAGQNLIGAQTFEFTHKSFGEYLTARRIANKLIQINSKLRENEKDFDEGWNTKKCLSEWIKLFGARSFDEDLMKYIKNEFNLKHTVDPRELIVLQETIIKLVSQVLREGMPLEEVIPRPSYYYENEQSINCEKALIILIGSLAEKTNIVSDIDWPSATSFGDWISRLMGQRLGPYNSIVQYLNHLNLTKSTLDIRDFYGANLRSGNLSYVSMYYANLFQANLTKANLQHAELNYTNLERATLKVATLKRTQLKGANLKMADLEGADLRGAQLEDAVLQEAKLDGANLQGAKLSGTNFKGASLKRVDLRNTNLEGVFFNDANLEGAIYK